MKRIRGKCFISYNHDDADRDTLDQIREWLVHAGSQQIQVLFDEDLDYGEDFDKFIALLEEVDSIIIIFTPGYKEKVTNRKGGVYKEYKIISDRYKQFEEGRRSEKDIPAKDCAFLPILFSGDPKASITDEFCLVKYLDLRNFRVRKNSKGEVTVAKPDERRFKREIATVVSRIFAVNSINSKEYRQYYDEIYSLLFERLKAEWSPAVTEEEKEIQDHLFVKTHAYDKVTRQSAYLLVGRKGSGKSTVTQFVQTRHNDRYKEPIPIVVDEFELDFIFGMFDIPSFESDTRNTITISKAFAFIWETFIYICCMETIVSEYGKGRFSPQQEKGIKVIIEYFKRAKREEEEATEGWKKSASFAYCMFALKEFMSKCIDNARDDTEYFYADILDLFRLDKFVDYVFGEDVVNAFYEVMSQCRRNFLISLDGFDTAFDEYRVLTLTKYPYDPELQQRRIRHEIEWLSSFLHVVLRMKSNHEQSVFYEKLDFCITIPKDRFIEVKAHERDSYNYERKYIDIHWSGLELTILLRKRLEILSNFRTEKHLSVEDRLDEILFECFPFIPMDTEITIAGRTYKQHIFLDVLRYTFWRPRDILFYFATIIAVSRNMKKKNRKVTNEVIRKLISDTTYAVIKSEFINEFKWVWFPCWAFPPISDIRRCEDIT